MGKLPQVRALKSEWLTWFLAADLQFDPENVESRGLWKGMRLAIGPYGKEKCAVAGDALAYIVTAGLCPFVLSGGTVTGETEKYDA